MSDVGRRIRTLRTGQGKGLADVAESTGLSKGYLSELETSDEVNPTLDVLQRVAEALDVTIADLLGTPTTQPKASSPAMLENAPDGLRQFARARKAQGDPLTADEIGWLASAHYRGRRPSSREDFEYLYRSLKTSAVHEMPKASRRRSGAGD